MSDKPRMLPDGSIVLPPNAITITSDEPQVIRHDWPVRLRRSGVCAVGVGGGEICMKLRGHDGEHDPDWPDITSDEEKP